VSYATSSWIQPRPGPRRRGCGRSVATAPGPRGLDRTEAGLRPLAVPCPQGSMIPEGARVDDKSLYAAILGVTQPWAVEKVELRLTDGEVHVWVALPTDTRWVCPECQAGAPIHDHRERVWRHLDTCQYRTLVHAQVPRLTCPTHGRSRGPRRGRALPPSSRPWPSTG
jgi:hypothetical protein